MGQNFEQPRNLKMPPLKTEKRVLFFRQSGITYTIIPCFVKLKRFIVKSFYTKLITEEKQTVDK